MSINTARVEPRYADVPGGASYTVTFEDFRTLEFEHHMTVLRTARPRTGRTLWRADGPRGVVALWWYWHEVLPGGVLVDNPYQIETSVQIADPPCGYPIAVMEAVYSLPNWQQVVLAAIDGLKPCRAEESPSLSPREREVLRWAQAGKTAWETGQILGVGEPCVKKTLRSVYIKLDSGNKPAAILAAQQLGLI